MATVYLKHIVETAQIEAVFFISDMRLRLF